MLKVNASYADSWGTIKSRHKKTACRKRFRPPSFPMGQRFESKSTDMGQHVYCTTESATTRRGTIVLVLGAIVKVFVISIT